jgi:DNA-binding response OmpR family regulator
LKPQSPGKPELTHANPFAMPQPAPRILIAEDQEDLREAVVEAFSDYDFEISAARDGLEAVTMFTEFKPDLAILDMRMPMIDGADVCLAIRESSEIPVIMFTSVDDAEDVKQAIKNGATDFVLKTTGFDELVQRVETLLQNVKRTPEVIDCRNIVLHEAETTSQAPKTTTLIVDPDSQSSSEIQLALTRLCQDYIEVSTAAEAKAAIQFYNPDIIITEWSLPDSDAFKLLKELKRGRMAKDLFKIVATTNLAPEIERKLRFAGVDEFLYKPLDRWAIERLFGDYVKKILNKNGRRAA